MHLYKKFIQNSDIPETRAEPIAEALRNLHSAICELDQQNKTRFGYLNPDAVHAAIAYAEIEELNCNLWGNDGNISVLSDPSINKDLNEDFYIVFTPDTPATDAETSDNVVTMEDYRNK